MSTIARLRQLHAKATSDISRERKSSLILHTSEVDLYYAIRDAIPAMLDAIEAAQLATAGVRNGDRNPHNAAIYTLADALSKLSATDKEGM